MRKYRQLTISALIAAILCILSPFSLPVFGIIPITLATLVIYLTVSVFEPKISVLSVCLYVLIGIIGLPVFSGFRGGIGAILSPTGGFILGYIPMTVISSLLLKINRVSYLWNIITMIISTLVLYSIGTLWFILLTDSSIKTAITVCILPFIIGDIIKILLSTVLTKIVKKRIIEI